MNLLYAPYERKLKTPFKNGRFSITKRKGLLFKLIEGEKVYYSEAAPLENFSTESYEELIAKNDCPSLRFALSMLKEETFLQPIYLNALRGIQDLQIGTTLFESHFQTLKLKISPLTQSSCLEFIKKTRETYPQIKIRLDANCSFQLEEAKDLCEKLKQFSPEYIEDPLINMEELPKLKLMSPLSFAVDSPLTNELNFSRALELPFDFFILKPSTIGAKEEIQETCNKIYQAKKKFILSSLFETEIGLRKLYSLASSFQLKEAQGFATANFFEKSFIKDAPLIENIPTYSKEENEYLDALPWKKWDNND